MNDRTQWENARSDHGPDQDRNRQQGGWDNSRRREQAPAQGQSGGGQQGGWHDDDRPQDWHSGGAYRQQGNSWSDQPQQREWRGSGQQGGYGGSSAGFVRDQSARPAGYARPDDTAGRREPWTSRSSAGRSDFARGDYGREDGDRDYSGNYRHDNWRSPGSQGFAGGYGMIDGPNAGRWSSGGAGWANPSAFGRGYGPDYGRDDGRGFLQRAGDQIASWFGGDDDDRQGDYGQRDYGQRNYGQGGFADRGGPNYRGHGPSDYTRSDERIREDANDRLTDDHRVDARRISVTVAKGELTLNGTVASREAKRRAEDSVEGISGVRHVQNNLRVDHEWSDAGRHPGFGPDAGRTGAAPTGSVTGSETGTGTATAAKPST